MNRFRTVFGFELSSYLKNKVIIGVTIFLVLASAIMLSFPRFTQGGGSGTDTGASADRPVMLIIAGGEEETARMREVFAGAFPGYDVREAGVTAEEAQEQIRSGKAGCAFVFTAPDACTYYVDNLGMNDTAPRTAAAALQAERRRSGMIENGVAPEKADEILGRVTQSLRDGMDEIRAVLRSERPDGRRKALLGLNLLCEECKTQYGIDVQLTIEGDSGRIDEKMWSVIYDNCCEAVTNAMKYAQCDSMRIEIRVLNQMLRCCVSDNGKGCRNIRDGMGLEGIKRRVAELSGTAHISGDNGFVINMLIPL